MMTGLPEYQRIEEAFKTVEAVVKDIRPGSTETNRSLHHLEIAEKYAYETRERAGIDERAATLAEGVATGGLVTEGSPYLVGERGPEVFSTFASGVHVAACPAWTTTSGRCSYPSTYCSCGSTNQGG